MAFLLAWPPAVKLIMSPLFPKSETLQASFYSPISSGTNRTGLNPTAYQARNELWGVAYSVVDNAKNQTRKLSDEAAKEFEKASAKAQAKTGKIELYSGKYYATCTFGGLLACVCNCGLLVLYLCLNLSYTYLM